VRDLLHFAKDLFVAARTARDAAARGTMPGREVSEADAARVSEASGYLRPPALASVSMSSTVNFGGRGPSQNFWRVVVAAPADLVQFEIYFANKLISYTGQLGTFGA
jgi:hypothetical protein